RSDSTGGLFREPSMTGRAPAISWRARLAPRSTSANRLSTMGRQSSTVTRAIGRGTLWAGPPGVKEGPDGGQLVPVHRGRLLVERPRLLRQGALAGRVPVQRPQGLRPQEPGLGQVLRRRAVRRER